MKSIETYGAYSAETAHLAELRRAEAAALQDEAQALATLAQPAERESALAAVGRLLAGEPMRRVDAAGVAQELTEVRQRLGLLRAAILEQENVIKTTRGVLSAKVNADALPAHLQAAAGIVAALESLRAALAAETSIRESFAAAGFACRLEPLAAPELDFDDPQSATNRLLRDARRYIEVSALRDGKGAVVLLLLDAPGLGVAGDVVRVDGPAAAALVSAGRGEVSGRKPGRVAQRVEPAAELVLS